MKTISTTAIVALMTASIGLGAVVPVLAQQADAPPAVEAQPASPAPAERPDRPGPGMRKGGLGGPDILSVERGAEAIEIALVRLSHAIDLTNEQKQLLDTLKTDALAAANTFEESAASLRPSEPDETATDTASDLSDRLDRRIALETARLDALKSVQPAFTAFFDSLTTEQKAGLMPERGDRMGGPGMHQGGFGPGKAGGPGEHSMRQGHN